MGWLGWDSAGGTPATPPASAPRGLSFQGRAPGAGPAASGGKQRLAGGGGGRNGQVTAPSIFRNRFNGASLAPSPGTHLDPVSPPRQD